MVERNNRFSILELAGIAGGTYTFNEYGKDSVRGFFEGIGETYDGLRTASRLLVPKENQKSEKVDEFLSYVKPQIAKDYKISSDITYLERIKSSSKEALEVLQRKALEYTPGIDSKPVTGIRSAKEGLIEWSKGLFSNEEKKEEIAITREPVYADNYNELAELRLAAIKKREELQKEINDYSLKLEINKVRTGEVSKSDASRLEGMLESHIKITGILENIANMKPKEIKEGIDNPQYKTLIQEAKKYEISPYDPHVWGDSAVLTGFLVSSYLGYKGMRAIEKSLGTVYEFAKKSIGTSIILGKGIYDLINRPKKRLNRSRPIQNHQEKLEDNLTEIMFGPNLNNGNLINGNQKD